jgi:carbamoyl-phosphate synthase large subunit
MKILVTGAGALLGQGILRCLRSSSLSPRVVAVDPSPLSAGLYWADAAHLVPRADSPRYGPAIDAILHREKPDAVLVGTDVELPFFASQRPRLEAEFSTFVLVSDPRVVAVADDKWLTFRFLEENGFSCPASCLPGEEDRLVDAVGFPLVVKPRVGARSVGVQVVRTREELKRALESRGGLVVQEAVGDSGEEYTAGTLSFEGACRASIVMKRDLRDGNTYRAYVEDYPELNRTVRRLADVLKPYGPANFQFRLDGKGARVFEINARFSGTTPLRALAGFNEVEMALRHILLGEPVTQPPIRRLVMLRHWSETAVSPDELVQQDAD